MSVLDIAPLLAPISDASPSGEDARYEFCYEMMEAEVKKFGSLFGETVDWGVVKTHSMEVLSQHSKDLKALCYLIRALAEESGLDGFHVGLELLGDTLEQFENRLYPTRKRGRDGAVEWLNHQFKLLCSKFSETPQSWESVSACATAIERVQSEFDRVFEDSDSDFFETRSQLNALMQQAVADSSPNETANDTAQVEVASPVVETPKVADIVQERSPKSEAPAQPLETKAKPVTRQEVEVDTDFTSPAASKRTLKKVAEVMIHADVSNALAYRIYRHLTWDDIDGLPDHKNNVTPLSLAVSTDQQSDYKDKANQESEVGTVKRLERTLTDAPFWLTGHFYVYSMLKNIGFDDAASAVKQETMRFVDAYPGVESLEFKNSVPFADEATRQWLAAKDQALSGANTAVQAVYVDSDDARQVDDITLENLGEHAAELAQKLELDNSGRGQFILYLQLIAAYQSVGLFPLCLPYLKRGWEVHKEFNLASWEPHLSTQLESFIRKTLQALYKSKDLLPVEYEEWQAMYD
ncbi:type VI secretion system protein TssA [Vibrio maritimus]